MIQDIFGDRKEFTEIRGKKLRECRKERRITIDDFAAMCGWDAERQMSIEEGYIRWLKQEEVNLIRAALLKTKSDLT